MLGSACRCVLLGIATGIALGTSLLASTLVGSCGGTTTTDTPNVGDPGSPVANACHSLATAYCARLSECFPRGFQARYPQTQTCIDRIELRCVSMAGAPGTSWNGERAAACAKIAPTASCDDYTSSFPCPTAPGALSDGASCYDDGQCASTYCKKSDIFHACGKCSTRGPVGASCDSPSGCDNNGQCVGKCTAAGAKGASCTNPTDCQPNLWCVSGLCRSRLGVGEACDAPMLMGACSTADLLYCNSATKTCAETLLAQPGATCGWDKGARTDCVNSVCVTGGPDAGACIPFHADGTACTLFSLADAFCTPPALCIGNACIIPGPTTCP